MDAEEVHRIGDIKAERIRIQMDHLRIKYDYEVKLKEAKYRMEIRKLELALMQIEGVVEQ